MEHEDGSVLAGVEDVEISTVSMSASFSFELLLTAERETAARLNASYWGALHGRCSVGVMME